MLSICIRNLFLVFLRVKTTYTIFSAAFPIKLTCLCEITYWPIFQISPLQKYEAVPEVLLPVKEAEMEAMRQPQSPGDRPSFEDYMRYKQNKNSKFCFNFRLRVWNIENAITIHYK
jgi:hypothetical protein